MTTTLVKRPARIAPPPMASTELEIAEPPTRGQGAPAMAGASMLMMPIMSGTGSITVALTNQSGNKIVPVAAFLALIGSIAIGVMMVIGQRSGTKRQVRESRERYLDYVEALRHAVREQITGQRAQQAWCYPNSDELLDIARDPARRWERRISHGDFLGIRIGTGEVPLAAGLTMTADTGPLNDFDPVCLQAAQELQHRYESLSDQPIVIPLRTLGQVSVLGNPVTRRQFAEHALVQIAALHSPNEVSLAVVRADETAPAWDWVKWLPHAQDSHEMDGDVPARRVTSSVGAMNDLLASEFEARLDRFQRSRGGKSLPPNNLVVVIDFEGLPTTQHVESPDPTVPLAALGVHVINLLDTAREEPEHVDERVEIDHLGTVTLRSRDKSFNLDVAAPGLAMTVARSVSALRLTAEEASEDGLVDTIGLPEILGVADPAKLDLGRTWRPRALRDLLRVPIGIGTQGQSVLLDLKESAHGGMGPHGMVVGATGSGKSEMLRTMVSSLVIGHEPERLALMLVDFKGGATFAPMENIPHIAGMITNLQDDLTLVDRMRDALYGEMQRRQEVLKQAGNLPNVTAYQDRIDAGEVLEPLPHLLVIIDEFSELLTAKPDFAELFVAIGRIGRSIGVHLLLATQKLEMGKIRGLESHLSYRVSLRTFSESESRDAIGVPDAYHLPPEPGSGYLKVDTTVFERFKAALVSSPYVPPTTGPKTAVPVVPYVAVNGLGAWLSQQAIESAAMAKNAAEEAAAAQAGSASVLDVLCEQIEGTGRAKVRYVNPPYYSPQQAQVEPMNHNDARAKARGELEGEYQKLLTPLGTAIEDVTRLLHNYDSANIKSLMLAGYIPSGYSGAYGIKLTPEEVLKARTAAYKLLLRDMTPEQQAQYVRDSLHPKGTYASGPSGPQVDPALVAALSPEAMALLGQQVATNIKKPYEVINRDDVAIITALKNSAPFSTTLYENVTPHEMAEELTLWNRRVFGLMQTDGPDPGSLAVYKDLMNGAGVALATYSNTLSPERAQALSNSWYGAITNNEHRGDAAPLTLLIRSGGRESEFNHEFLGSLTNRVYDWERKQDGAVWNPRQPAPFWDPNQPPVGLHNITDDSIPPLSGNDALANLLGGMAKSPEAARDFFNDGKGGVDQKKLDYLVGNNPDDPTGRTFSAVNGSDEGAGLGAALEAATVGEGRNALSDELATDTFNRIAALSGKGGDAEADDSWHIWPGMAKHLGTIGAGYSSDIFTTLDSGDDTGATALHVGRDELYKVLGEIGRGSDKSGVETLTSALAVEGQQRTGEQIDSFVKTWKDTHNGAVPTLADLQASKDWSDIKGAQDKLGAVLGNAVKHAITVDVADQGLAETRAAYVSKAIDVATAFLPGAGSILGEGASEFAKTSLDLAKGEGIDALKSAVASGGPAASTGQSYLDGSRGSTSVRLEYGFATQLAQRDLLKDVPPELIDPKTNNIRADLYDGDGSRIFDTTGMTDAEVKATKQAWSSWYSQSDTSLAIADASSSAKNAFDRVINGADR